MPKYYALKQIMKIQAIGWSIYYLLMILINANLNPLRTPLDLAMGLVLLIVVFNCCVAHLWLIWMTKYWWLGMLLLLGFFFPAANLVYIYVYKVMPEAGHQIFKVYPSADHTLFYWRMFDRYLNVLVLATVLVLHFRYRRTWFEKQRADEIRHEQELLAKDSELAFLVAQINPHFLYNVLSNLQQQSSLVLPQVAHALTQLAQVLEYSLNNASKRIKKVVIEKELKALKDYLSLEKSRFERCYADLVVTGELCGQKLPPLILITLAENAFKYGVCQQALQPIQMLLHVDDNLLQFTCSNWIADGKREHHSTKMGLANIRYRLDMIFPGKHRFEIDTSLPDRFTVNLIIEQ